LKVGEERGEKMKGVEKKGRSGEELRVGDRTGIVWKVEERQE
jgi:hypothetical protein|tara:strand:- start:899 stop:1024 length:126 start_codon:yes stop_codon:yes gene_type:complete